MKKLKNVKAYSILFFTALLIFSCKKQKKNTLSSRVEALPYYNEASFTPKWIASNDKELKDFHKIPDLNLQINMESK